MEKVTQCDPSADNMGSGPESGTQKPLHAHVIPKITTVHYEDYEKSNDLIDETDTHDTNMVPERFVISLPQITAHNEDVACRQCGGTPCYWIQHAPSVVSKTAVSYPALGLCSDENNEARKQAYKAFTYERYGILGKGKRIRLPHCVMEGVRRIWPDAVGTYMGFKDD